MLFTLPLSDFNAFSASSGYSSTLRDHNNALCGQSSALWGYKSTIQGNSSARSYYTQVNYVIIIVHYGVVVLWGRVL